MALHDVQGVGREVFAGDKPWRVFATATSLSFGFQAANAQPLALAQGVKAQADVLANALAEFVFDRARLVGDVAIQKLTKRTLTYKTDAG